MPFRSPSLGGLPLLLLGCAAPTDAGDGAAQELLQTAPLPFELRSGDRVTVTYRSGGAVLPMSNGAAAARTRGGKAIKIASDEDIRRLLSAWATPGFFRDSVDAVPSEARGALVVNVNDRTWHRVRTPQDMAAAAGRFNDCVEVFRYVYDNTLSFHAVEGLTGDDLEAEARRLEREAASGRRRGDS